MAESPTREAFHEFLDAIKTIDVDYYNETRNITSEADIAEGEHSLLHLLKVGMEIALDNHADRPHFSLLITPTQKFGGDGPDHPVYYAPLNPQRAYRVRGKLTGEVYLSFTVHTGDRETLWGDGVVSEINHQGLNIEEDGSYELTLSQNEADANGGNWMRINDATICVITRHYYQNETPAVSDPDIHPNLGIDPIGDWTPPLPLQPEEFARRLKVVAGYMRGHTTDRPIQSPDTLPDWFSSVPNTLPQPQVWVNEDGGGFGAVDNAYSACPFVLAPDEALVMEGRIPECTYANVCLWNRYLQTFDHRYSQIGLNKTQMTLDADNRFRIVIAHKDPGIKDWLFTEGRAFGTIYWRFLLAGDNIDKPVCTVVKFDEL